MTVWITGARGMLGHCVAEHLTRLGVAWVGTDAELDIAEHAAVSAFLREAQASHVINCAAYTAVDAAEADEEIAHRVNAVGTAVLARACHEQSTSFTHVSTDYVFDGERPEPHDENSPVGPCNAYGRTKLDGERLVVAEFAHDPSPPSWVIARTSWLFGSGRSSFVDTMYKLMLERTEVRVVNDQHGRPTYAADLAAFLVRASGAARDPALASGIWHFANSGPTTWFGLATEIRNEMIAAGVPVAATKLIPVTTAEFPRPARRPKNSVLSTKRLESEAGILPRSWREALHDYVALCARSAAGS